MVSYSSDPKRAKSLRLILILKFKNVHEIVWDNIPENKNLSIRESLKSVSSHLSKIADRKKCQTQKNIKSVSFNI